MVGEFPRVKAALIAQPTRFVYLPTITDTLRRAKPSSTTFNTMMKVNTEAADFVRHDFGNKADQSSAYISPGRTLRY